MIPPFDILRVEADGHPRWVEASGTLEDAKARIAELMKSRPSEYLIISQRTGNKFHVHPEQTSGRAARNELTS